MKKEKKTKTEKTSLKEKISSFFENHKKLKYFCTNKYVVSSFLLTINIYIIEMYLRLVTDAPFNDFGVIRIFISSFCLGLIRKDVLSLR